MITDLKDSTLLRTCGLINGLWKESNKGARFEVNDPGTARPLAHVSDLDQEETEEAIQAAAVAFRDWKSRTAKDRSRLLRNWYDLILMHQEDLAKVLTSEQGKPLSEARAEIIYGASFVEFFSEEAKRTYGEIIPSPAVSKKITVLNLPLGVTAAITPWNFPVAMITRKVSPALAAGCTSVIKPAEATPLSALALGELAQRAGIPAGVLNIIPTSRPARVGELLASHPLVRKLSFTGSTAVGKKLMSLASSTVKRLSLELGGNAPFIVFDDADLDLAVEGALLSKFRNAGQTCVCANRMLVQSVIYEAFVDRLTQRVSELVVGHGLVPQTTIGPLINPAALDKVEALITDAQNHGARVEIGGKALQGPGTFFEPTVITGVTSKMRISREEIFGPVAIIQKFTTEAEVVGLANDTPYGLAAYFYTRDISRAWRVAEDLEFGMVGLNDGLISNEVAPFGGIKESGFGIEGSHHGINEYLHKKYFCLGAMN